jgi:HEAT repeat protein
VRVDLQKKSSEELVDLQLHRNDWYVRHARRILQERGPDPKVHARLQAMLRDNPDVTRKLRALWALHVTGGLSDVDKVKLLDHDSEYLRSWAVYLLVEGRNPPRDAVKQFARLAKEDPSALVRLYLASALQRVPVEQRWEVLEGLMAHPEDAGDHNLPLMVWYAAEPMAPLDMQRLLTMSGNTKLPGMFGYAVQRIAALQSPEALRLLADRLAHTTDPAQQLELVDGINRLVKKEPASTGTK